MNTAALSQSYNPKNQLSFMPFQPQPTSSSSVVKIQQIPQPQISQTKEICFYQTQIAKLAYANTVIMAQLETALQEKKIIMKLISQAEKQEQISIDIENDKRVRRCAKDIERKHKCPQKGCEKSYGTEGSLFQHIRLKHPKINTHDPPLMLDPA